MTIQIETTSTLPEAVVARIEPDRRLHRRVSLTLFGRFMLSNKQEYPCKSIDISVGGVSLMSPVPAEEGESIIVYLDQLGGLQGEVARQFPGGFALSFNITRHRREKLAAQITWLINRHELSAIDRRRSERLIPRNSSSLLSLEGGAVLQCQVIDVSISGASVATHARPPLNSEVVLGKLRSRVVRHHDQGIAVRFLDVQQPTALRRYFG